MLGLATLWLSLCPPARLSAQSPIIDTVIVVNHNIFADSDQAPTFLSRVINGLHRTTRAGVIRRTILLEAGMPYDSARAVESERLLRDLGVFRDIHLDTIRVDGRLALRVVTGDGWSTSLNAGYTTTAGSVSWQIVATERNLLGSATALSVGFHHDPDRHSYNFLYENAAFLFRRTLLGLEYSDLSDGRAGKWTYGVPFYETGARWSLVDSGQAANQRVLHFRDGVLTDSSRRKVLISSTTLGWAPLATTRDYLRLTLGVLVRREDYASYTTVPYPRSVFGSAGLMAERGHVRYAQIEHLNSFGRHEDLDLSQIVGVGVWVAPKAWGYGAGHDGVGPAGHVQVSAVWRGGFVLARAAGRGVITGAGVDSGRVTGSMTLVSQALPSQTWIMHLEGGRIRNPAPGGEFDLWRDGNGPRLFAAHAFTGDRMGWLAVEDRIVLAKEVWGLFGVGVAPFFDWGGAWYTDEPVHAGGDVGAAFRLGPTRSIGGDVVELAVGYRMGSGFVGRGWALTLGTGIFYQ